MAQIKQSKKQMPFGMLLGLFGGGFVLLIVIGLAVASMMGGNNAPPVPVAPQPEAQQVAPYQQSAQGQEAGNDINSYIDGETQKRGMQAISEQLNVMQTQMTAMQTEFNQGNANMGVQLQKIQNDMILLDRRITAIENALKANSYNQPMSGSGSSKGGQWKRERQPKGAAVKDSTVVAASNGRVWVQDGQNSALEVGDSLNGKRITAIDDVRTKVYVN